MDCFFLTSKVMRWKTVKAPETIRFSLSRVTLPGNFDSKVWETLKGLLQMFWQGDPKLPLQRRRRRKRRRSTLFNVSHMKQRFTRVILTTSFSLRCFYCLCSFPDFPLWYKILNMFIRSSRSAPVSASPPHSQPPI